jgi:hypothetical protein
MALGLQSPWQVNDIRFLMMEALAKSFTYISVLTEAHVFQMRPVSPVQCMTP